MSRHTVTTMVTSLKEQRIQRMQDTGAFDPLDLPKEEFEEGEI